MALPVVQFLERKNGLFLFIATQFATLVLVLSGHSCLCQCVTRKPKAIFPMLRRMRNMSFFSIIPIPKNNVINWL